MAKDTRAHEALGNELLDLIRTLVEERIRKFANGDRVRGSSIQGPVSPGSIPSWVTTDQELAAEVATLNSAISAVATDLTSHEGTIASAGSLGHIRVGSNLSIDGNGILSALVGTHGSTHVSNGSDPIPGATGSVGGLMSSGDKTKLDLLTLPLATTISGGGTVALGGFTLTVPATGTAALLGAANAFTQNNTFGGTVAVTGAISAGNISTTPTANYIPQADGTGKIAAGWLPAAAPAAHASTHLTGGTDPIALATTAINGLMSAGDKTKLSYLTINTDVTFSSGGYISFLGTNYFIATSGTGTDSIAVASVSNTFTRFQQIRPHASTPSAHALQVGWTAGDTLPTATFGATNTSNNQIAVHGVSYSSHGLQGTSTTGSAGRFINDNTSTLVTNAMSVEHHRTTATGIGVGIEFKATTSTAVEQMGQLYFDWTNTTSASRTSECVITVHQNGNSITTAKFDYQNSTTVTGFALLYGTTLKRVQVGMENSGGVGFRMLTIAN